MPISNISSSTCSHCGCSGVRSLAFGVMHPNAVIMLLIPPIPMKAKWFVIIYAVIELFLGWRGVGNVAHFAHVGGMLWGFLLLHWWKRRGTIRF